MERQSLSSLVALGFAWGAGSDGGFGSIGMFSAEAIGAATSGGGAMIVTELR